MRGEHRRTGLSRGTSAGSSPHARGALAVFSLRVLRDGVIPACAGSTAMRIKNRAKGGGHPRMRGEHGRPSHQ